MYLMFRFAVRFLLDFSAFLPKQTPKPVPIALPAMFPSTRVYWHALTIPAKRTRGISSGRSATLARGVLLPVQCVHENIYRSSNPCRDGRTRDDF